MPDFGTGREKGVETPKSGTTLDWLDTIIFFFTVILQLVARY